MPVFPLAALSAALLAAGQGLFSLDLPAWIPWPGAVLCAGVAGVLTALTPGLYPLIPISLVAFGRGPLRRLGASLLFAGALAAGLAGLCVLAAAFGMAAAAPLSSAAGLGFLTLLCVVTGAAMVGLFPMQLPPALTARLASVRGGGPFAVALVSLPVATPWLAPQVAVLAAVCMVGRAPLQGAAMGAAFAAGLAVPWLAVAVTNRRAVSRGVWMEVVRLVLAAAHWTLGLILLAQAWPEGATLVRRASGLPAVWGMALLLLGSGGGALMLTSRRLARATWLRSTAALLMAVGLGGALLEMSRDLAQDDAPAIAWEADPEAALARARMERKPLVMDFTAEWCQPCQQLERTTYRDPAVRRAAASMVMAQIDCTAMDAAAQALFARYKIVGLPTVLFFDADGQLLQQPRLTGYVGPTRFVELLHSVR